MEEGKVGFVEGISDVIPTLDAVRLRDENKVKIDGSVDQLPHRGLEWGTAKLIRLEDNSICLEADRLKSPGFEGRGALVQICSWLARTRGIPQTESQPLILGLYAQLVGIDELIPSETE